AEPRGIAAGYKWPQFSIHRGELLGILYRAVVARLGAGRVHAGHHLIRFGNVPLDNREASGAWGEFALRDENGALGDEIKRCEVDARVACDGVHSAVRAGRYRDEG